MDHCEFSLFFSSATARAAALKVTRSGRPTKPSVHRRLVGRKRRPCSARRRASPRRSASLIRKTGPRATQHKTRKVFGPSMRCSVRRCPRRPAPRSRSRIQNSRQRRRASEEGVDEGERGTGFCCEVRSSKGSAATPHRLLFRTLRSPENVATAAGASASRRGTDGGSYSGYRWNGPAVARNQPGDMNGPHAGEAPGRRPPAPLGRVQDAPGTVAEQMEGDPKSFVEKLGRRPPSRSKPNHAARPPGKRGSERD